MFNTCRAHGYTVGALTVQTWDLVLHLSDEVQYLWMYVRRSQHQVSSNSKRCLYILY
jgi:hypothetical protein